MSETIKSGHGGARPGAGRPWKIADNRPVPDVPRWYAVRTDPGQETSAAFDIGIAGFAVFLPVVWHPASPASRVGRAICPARPARVAPLFPRYLFVRFRRADHWQPIRAVPGVERLLGTAPDDPVPVPDGAIDAVRGLPGMATNGCRYPAGLDDLSGLAPLQLGSTARVLDGPLADTSGVVTYCDAKTARMLVRLLGAAVALTVPRASVATVESAGPYA